jgi:hypothetical protein
MSAQITQALAALKTTAGNIKSLRVCYTQVTFDLWLDVVEAAIVAIEAAPGCIDRDVGALFIAQQCDQAGEVFATEGTA